MQILNSTGIDLSEERLMSVPYMDKSVDVWMEQDGLRSAKTASGVRQGCCLSPILLIQRIALAYIHVRAPLFIVV